MSSYCGVTGCKNNSKIMPHLSYYSLPKDEDRKKIWIERMQRNDLLTKETRSKHYVCSEHFSKDTIKTKRLKSDAVPTLYLPYPLSSEKHKNINFEAQLTVEIKQEPSVHLQPDTDQSVECPSPVPSSSHLQISSTRSIKRSHSSSSRNSEEHTELPLEDMPDQNNHETHHKPSETHGYDEYDHFGLMIASKIRKIDDFEERETVMNVIQNVVFQSVMKVMASKNTS